MPRKTPAKRPSGRPSKDALTDEPDATRDNPRRRREARSEREDNDRHPLPTPQSLPGHGHRTTE